MTTETNKNEVENFRERLAVNEVQIAHAIESIDKHVGDCFEYRKKIDTTMSGIYGEIKTLNTNLSSAKTAQHKKERNVFMSVIGGMFAIILTLSGWLYSTKSKAEVYHGFYQSTNQVKDNYSQLHYYVVRHYSSFNVKSRNNRASIDRQNWLYRINWYLCIKLFNSGFFTYDYQCPYGRD